MAALPALLSPGKDKTDPASGAVCLAGTLTCVKDTGTGEAFNGHRRACNPWGVCTYGVEPYCVQGTLAPHVPGVTPRKAFALATVRRNFYPAFTGTDRIFTPSLCAAGHHNVRCCMHVHELETAMMDLLYIGLMVGFVAVSVALVYGFERLRRPS